MLAFYTALTQTTPFSVGRYWPVTVSHPPAKMNSFNPYVVLSHLIKVCVCVEHKVVTCLRIVLKETLIVRYIGKKPTKSVISFVTTLTWMY